MNAPKIDIQNELEKHKNNLLKEYFAVEMDTHALIISPVRGNTLRAYKKDKCYINYKPSSIFRNWAYHEYFTNPKKLELLNSGEDFEMIHNDAVSSLSEHWWKCEPGLNKNNFKAYHIIKLVDLIFKFVPKWTGLSKARRDWFFNHVHIPIDKYSLIALRDATPRGFLGLRNNNTSMNFVKSKKHYDEIQQEIKKLIGAYPPILFDLYAWNYLRTQYRDGVNAFDLVSVE